jgi:imidazolonepropionase-like amidohydrolase
MTVTRMVLGGGEVFDSRGGTIGPADVAIEDARIVDVGTGLDGDERIDVSGRTLLPGLFDCHTHVAITDLDQWRMLQRPFSLMFYEAARNLEATLDAGITTIRDAGGADLGMKSAVEMGLIRGPRMHISIGMISQTGGHGDNWMASGALVPFFIEHPGRPGTVVDGPEHMRKKVRELIRNGADVIKVATSGGVMSPRDDPRHPHFSQEELDMLVSEARSAGRWVMAHAQGAEGIKRAIRAGIRSIDHGVFLDEEAIAMMLEADTYLVPTLLAPSGVLLAAERGVAIPEASLAKAREVIEIHREAIRKAIQAGVRVAMGTDSGVTPHGENLRELELMADLGMAPPQVLRATTLTAAELMGLQDELGALEPGKRADVVVIDGDPFDFKVLPDRIESVWKDGQRVSR